jgi:hypothetical protein
MTVAGCTCREGIEPDTRDAGDSGTIDAGRDGGEDAGPQADAGNDAGLDAGGDAGQDGGVDGGRCLPAALMPRTEPGATSTADGKLYVVGGLVGGGANAHVSPLVEAVDPATGDVWVSGMPTARSSPLAATGPDGKIYVAGGLDDFGVPLDTFEVLDRATGQWSSLPPMPTRAGPASGGFIGTQLYVLTWVAAGQIIQLYDLSTQSWHSKPVPMASQGQPAATLNGRLAILVPPMVSALSQPDGGLVFAMFDPTGTWSTGSPSTAATSGGGLTGHGGALAAGDAMLYVVGGIFPGGGVSASMQSYSSATDTWYDLPRMPTARGALAAATAQGRLYAIDGQGIGGNPLGLMETYDIGTQTWHGVSVTCEVASFDAGIPGCAVTPPPSDGGVCGGSLTQTQATLPLSGGAFDVLSPNVLLIRFEEQCGFTCSNPHSLCGNYQWLDLLVVAHALVPGTYPVEDLLPTNVNLAKADGGMSAALLTYLESVGQQSYNVGVTAFPGSGSSVTIASIGPTQLSGTYDLWMPEVIDGGEVFTDAGCPGGHPLCPVVVPHSGTFTVPAASCTLQTGFPPL